MYMFYHYCYQLINKDLNQHHQHGRNQQWLVATLDTKYYGQLKWGPWYNASVNVPLTEYLVYQWNTRRQHKPASCYHRWHKMLLLFQQMIWFTIVLLLNLQQMLWQPLRQRQHPRLQPLRQRRHLRQHPCKVVDIFIEVFVLSMINCTAIGQSFIIRECLGVLVWFLLWRWYP